MALAPKATVAPAAVQAYQRWRAHHPGGLTGVAHAVSTATAIGVAAGHAGAGTGRSSDATTSFPAKTSTETGRTPGRCNATSCGPGTVQIGENNGVVPTLFPSSVAGRTPARGADRNLGLGPSFARSSVSDCRASARISGAASRLDARNF